MTEKPNLEVIMSTILPYKKGDFGAIVNKEEGKMYLPLPIYKAFENALGGRTNIKRTDLLVSSIVTFPTCFKEIQKDLGWNDEEFKQAEEKLMQTLRQYAPAEYFDPEPQMVYGAMPPNPSYVGKTPEQLKNMKKN